MDTVMYDKYVSAAIFTKLSAVCRNYVQVYNTEFQPHWSMNIQ